MTFNPIPSRYIVQVEHDRTPPAVASAAAAAVQTKQEDAKQLEAIHSPDWATVLWYGRRYNFPGKLQRAAIAILWNAWEQGYLDVLEQTVLREADSDSVNLKDLFRGNTAWGTLIQRSSAVGGPAGAVRLVKPEEADAIAQ